MDFMQGEARKQYIMFPELLDDYITEDNPTRVIIASNLTYNGGISNAEVR